MKQKCSLKACHHAKSAHKGRLNADNKWIIQCLLCWSAYEDHGFCTKAKFIKDLRRR